MQELIFYYTAGMLVSSGIIIIWNFSTISIHALGWIYKDRDITTIYDLGDAIAEKHPNISELLYCPICLGFWTSIITASVFCYVNSLTYFFIPVCGFSWPLFIYLFYNYFNNHDSQ